MEYTKKQEQEEVKEFEEYEKTLISKVQYLPMTKHMVDLNLGDEVFELKNVKEFLKTIFEDISKHEKHGQIILSAEKVDDEFIRKSLNPTHEDEIESLKEEHKIDLASQRISVVNDLCYEIKQQIKSRAGKELL